MAHKEGGLFTVVVSASGRSDTVGFHLNVWERTDNDSFEPRVQYDGRVKLDGDEYGPAEWVREVMMGIIEGL